MKPIIPPVDKRLIERELTESKFLRNTNYGKRQIFIVTYHDSPNIIREIGRLRELSFRDAGGGTGNELDIDVYDTAGVPFKQLIVWDPYDEEIIGGYRYIQMKNLPRLPSGQLDSPTARLFEFSNRFIDEFVPVTIELGRSFIQPSYQATFNVRKGMFSLDNLWDGLGALVIEHPSIKYFFGKMTMYRNYNPRARDILLHFLQKFFPDPDHLVWPHSSLEVKPEDVDIDSLFNGSTYEDNYRLLNQAIRKFNENIPPLVNAYMNLSPTMRYFGTAINHKFGEVDEGGILITIQDVYEKKKRRHLATYIPKFQLPKFKLHISRRREE
ncbi:MAG TPA: GNAT family N-acyltransferase [Bacteroidales bacterium]|nr:GNAT family N-acetyltransferase [Bacteroidales bacterium]MDI9574686.1 GNAT family N-acyltransferase [Bacteroidota bacterium]OQC60833.1 MAG: hypothetical protein BWX51_00788 [Bacteroidetes bacterium ADurb.Bin012]MBP9511144.1 GNAT family N-acetyltransferase [Bacteroidales bacterium]MBP9588358.1 GNAT family N-acetyltransferase [Bacteroidales bacterium]